jgi:ribosome-associated toxin RatA of RatAB toxin-antitoxin module
MFELVDRCEDYPAFLPWCSRTELKFRDAAKTVATLHINYHAVKSSFTTENDKQFPTLMNIRLVDGPFRRLEGSWHFRPWPKMPARSNFACIMSFPASCSRR